MKKIKWPKLNRNIHYWASGICAIPLLIIIISGIFLQLRKDINWIQPATIKTHIKTPSISFNQLLEKAKTVSEANINGWEDINRVDYRPQKGIIKIKSNNHWEIQLNPKNADILQVAYRRSDIIESIHDGTFFSKIVSLGVYLPTAILLLILWFTGTYLFIKTILLKKK
ncbi:hypothetical protein DID76_04300 [Candidatus Marinamargulisbacteria bacterium SCGC AG-414-C22]|nr:hypothetical protein DID76_04300 [Candidatus Marinamargulisbacteria bacterium SCGC AG-414-C22]